MAWFIGCIGLIIVLLIGIWFLKQFYAKATLDTALVRTGLGGRKIIMDGGCFALPIVHQIQKVSMQAVSITIDRTGRAAVLTKDQLRADIQTEFELRVAPNAEAIGTAAQALGSRIARSGEVVEEVLQGALANAIQVAAAARDLADIHLDRAGFTDEVYALVQSQAERNGLTLVSASLVSVDQSDLTAMNEQNAFNAKGMRRLAELVAEERKARIAVETSTEIAVREHRLAQHERQLELKRTEREAEIDQQEQLAKREAEADSRAEQARAEARRAADAVRIEKERMTKAAQVANDEALRRSEMEAILTLEQAKIDNDIALARKRAEEAEARAEEESARAQIILAAENVQAKKDRAITEREREIARMKQERDIELENAKVKSDVETLLEKARADAAAKTTAAEADRAVMEAEAAGRKALNTAENGLSDAIIRMRLEERKLDRMPEIMTQMMKPVEKIDSIKINQIAGLGGSSGAGGEGPEGAMGTAMDKILGMAVSLPAMKAMGEEIGLDFDANLAGRTADYANRIKKKD